MKLRNKTTKPKIDISTTIFDKVISYCFSKYINRPFIKKLKNFFDIVSTTDYIQDTDLSPRYKLLNLIIKYYYDESIDDDELLLEKIVEDKSIDDEDKEYLLSVTLKYSEKISSNDALAIENLIIDRYNYAATTNPISKLNEILANYNKNKYNSYESIIKEIHEQTILFNKALAAKSASNLEIPEIDFSSESFKTVFTKIHKELTDQKRYVKTGIRKLNDFLSGGWQPGRVYVILGITGGLNSGHVKVY